MPDIKLNVPFFAQCDNAEWAESDGYGVEGNVQCAVTSNAMLVAFLKPELMKSPAVRAFSEPESWLKALVTDLGYTADDRGNHTVYTEALETLGIKSQWRTDLTDTLITAELKAGRPVVCGFCYKEAGHICVIVGRTDKGYLVNDPYGLRSGSSDEYSYINPGFGETSGSFDLFTWANLEVTLFNNDGKRQGAWGRIVAPKKQ
jgi:hypothetical protein